MNDEKIKQQKYKKLDLLIKVLNYEIKRKEIKN